jgi:hypothetical protein
MKYQLEVEIDLDAHCEALGKYASSSSYVMTGTGRA